MSVKRKQIERQNKQVMEMIKGGLSVSDACDKVGIKSRVFLQRIRRWQYSDAWKQKDV